MKRILTILLLIVPIWVNAQISLDTITPVNVGTTAGDGTGDTVRVAFQKVNTSLTNLQSNDNTLRNAISSGGIQFSDTLGLIFTKYDGDTLKQSVYDSINDLRNDIGTGGSGLTEGQVSSLVGDTADVLRSEWRSDIGDSISNATFTESQISDLTHFTVSDEADQVWVGDSADYLSKSSYTDSIEAEASATRTLTNKTIDYNSNTITNLPSTIIKDSVETADRTIYVDVSGNDSWDGTTLETAYATFDKALRSLKPVIGNGVTITFALTGKSYYIYDNGTTIRSTLYYKQITNNGKIIFQGDTTLQESNITMSNPRSYDPFKYDVTHDGTWTSNDQIRRFIKDGSSLYPIFENEDDSIVVAGDGVSGTEIYSLNDLNILSDLHIQGGKVEFKWFKIVNQGDYNFYDGDELTFIECEIWSSSTSNELFFINIPNLNFVRCFVHTCELFLYNSYGNMTNSVFQNAVSDALITLNNSRAILNNGNVFKNTLDNTNALGITTVNNSILDIKGNYQHLDYTRTFLEVFDYSKITSAYTDTLILGVSVDNLIKNQTSDLNPVNITMNHGYLGSFIATTIQTTDFANVNTPNLDRKVYVKDSLEYEFTIDSANVVSIYSTPYEITYAASMTFDGNNGMNQYTTLTGNVTSLTLSNFKPGGTYKLDVYQDGTGGRTFDVTAFDNKYSQSADFSIDAGATNTFVIDIKFNGDIYYSIITAP